MQVTGHAGGTAPRTTYDAVERALATCLAALADLAGSAGQADRVARLLAAAQALSATVPPPRPPTAGGPMPLDRVADGDQLTAREHEVARFIARGLTNRQIGEELIISERTADTHVQNILGKLHLVSRAQVAAWVIERRAVSGDPAGRARPGADRSEAPRA